MSIGAPPQLEAKYDGDHSAPRRWRQGGEFQTSFRSDVADTPLSEATRLDKAMSGQIVSWAWIPKCSSTGTPLKVQEGQSAKCHSATGTRP